MGGTKRNARNAISIIITKNFLKFVANFKLTVQKEEKKLDCQSKYGRLHIC